MPDGGLVHYTRIINPASPSDNAFTTAHFITNTPGIFYRSQVCRLRALCCLVA
jgi:hypothetical protein